jgi:hypothetical protein
LSAITQTGASFVIASSSEVKISSRNFSFVMK